MENNDLSYAYAFYEYAGKGFESYRDDHEYTEEEAELAFAHCAMMFRKYANQYTPDQMLEAVTNG